MRIEWTVFAMEDREAIFEYVAADNVRAAVRLDDRIEQHVELLADSPELGRAGRVPGTRELVIDQTPYIAAYRLEPETILLLRVIHGAREWPEEL